jgi:hypothetical protein
MDSEEGQGLQLRAARRVAHQTRSAIRSECATKPPLSIWRADFRRWRIELLQGLLGREQGVVGVFATVGVCNRDADRPG